MKVRNLRSCVMVAMSEEHTTPRPRALRPVQHGAAREMSAAADQRHVRQELERVAVPKLIAGSGRIIQSRSAECRWIGTLPKARLHSTIVV